MSTSTKKKPTGQKDSKKTPTAKPTQPLVKRNVVYQRKLSTQELADIGKKLIPKIEAKIKELEQK